MPKPDSHTTLPMVPSRDVKPLSRDVVKEIAVDIGREAASHIETMYPQAVAATSSTFLLSVRNCVYNEIMAALETIDEQAIRDRLEERRSFRRRHRTAWRKIRKQDVTEDVIHDA